MELAVAQEASGHGLAALTTFTGARAMTVSFPNGEWASKTYLKNKNSKSRSFQVLKNVFSVTFS